MHLAQRGNDGTLTLALSHVMGEGILVIAKSCVFELP